MVELSVVVPVYCCADCLPALYDRLKAVLQPLVASYELVFVEDCGVDQSWQVLRQIALQDPAVKAFQLSRNFGQHAAITAGLSQCTGRWAVVMDCDLQDPPEAIPALYAQAQAGFDVVLARRKIRQGSWFKRLSAKLYFQVLSFFTQRQIEGEYGSFSLISRKVIDAYLRFRDQDRHYLFILQWLGFPTVAIAYNHGKRHSGQSSYTLRTLIKHALDGMFFQTTILLKLIVYTGFLLSGSGVLLALYYTYHNIFIGSVPGWTSIIVLLLLIGGFIIISTGIIGLYIGKIFEQVKERPLFVLSRVIQNGVEE